MPTSSGVSMLKPSDAGPAGPREQVFARGASLVASVPRVILQPARRPMPIRNHAPRLGALLALVTLAAPTLVRAQGAPGPAIPIGMDMRKAKVGAWSEYNLSVADLPSMKQRFSLVSRDAAV